MNALNQFKYILYQLSRPFSYLKIRHEDKWVYDWFLPTLLTVTTLLFLHFKVPFESIGGEDGVISNLTSFVANLPGFFIAALAAVATFNKNDIDQPMANPPKINILYEGGFLMVDMTRRRFLCVLFSYLTAVSVFLVIFANIGLRTAVITEYHILATWVAVTIFFLMFWQMILATILGLYYLGERLHSPQ
jgi:hypothetical protein